MNMIPQTSKERWRRIPKDYFKKADGVQRTKRTLWIVALVITLVWCAWGLVSVNKAGSSTDGLSLRANHGELAKVHAAWDVKCDACHVPFEPINGRSLLTGKSTPESRTSDKLCSSCHAGPTHHVAMKDPEGRSCSECHRDHRGREVSLVRLDDNECTRCHQALPTYTDTTEKQKLGTRSYADVIHRFDQDHPKFRPDAAKILPPKAPETAETLEDRSGLKFNHALHLTLGLVKDPKDRPLFTAEKIKIASEQKRYQGKTLQDPVQLDCNSCHVLEASDLKTGPTSLASSTSRPDRSDGKYYQPVNFESHCAACHDLTFDPNSPDLRVPHGTQPQAVVAFLKGTFASQMFDKEPALLNEFVSSAPLPGASPASKEPREKFDNSMKLAIETMFGKAEEADLHKNKQNCHECHSSTPADPATDVPAAIVPTNVPLVWFSHAKFDHTAHRGVSCIDCHAQAYVVDLQGKPLATASRTSKDVMLPKLESCQECHSPGNGSSSWLPWSSSTPASKGGVAFNCTECHGYHNGDHALAGVGASAESATRERMIAEFLMGKGGKAVNP